MTTAELMPGHGNDRSRHPNLWPPFTQIAQHRCRRGDLREGALLHRAQGRPDRYCRQLVVTLHGHGHPVMAKAIMNRPPGQAGDLCRFHP